MSKKMDWVNAEMKRQLSGKSLTPKQRQKIMKVIWKEARRKFD